jgi:anti-sigma factor (TIGR02949 family)
MTTLNEHCGRVIERLDCYLDHELTAGDSADVQQHLAACATCRAELDAKTELRNRLRSAVRATSPASDDLRALIAERIKVTPAPRTAPSYAKWMMAAAASVALTTTSVIAYQLGHLRLTVASQDAYIAKISERVGSVMAIGLKDHVHCTVFRKKMEPPSPEKIQADMGPQFAGLAQVVRDNIPADQTLAMAHRCGYRGRKFVHIALTDGTHRSSLVIAFRQPGENFSTSGLVPALRDGGLPMYRSAVQRFEIDGFQTGSYLVYFISDMPRGATDRVVARLAQPVRNYLAKLES